MAFAHSFLHLDNTIFSWGQFTFLYFHICNFSYYAINCAAQVIIHIAVLLKIWWLNSIKELQDISFRHAFSLLLNDATVESVWSWWLKVYFAFSCRKKVLSSVRVTTWMKQAQTEMERLCKRRQPVMPLLLLTGKVWQFAALLDCLTNLLYLLPSQEHPLLGESAGVLQDAGWENRESKKWQSPSAECVFF